MLLIGKKVRRKFIESILPISVNGDYLNDDQVKVLLYNIKNDTEVEESKQRLIINFIGLARSIASSYANQAPHLADDLLGEAMHQLTRSVSIGLKDISHDNVHGYISRCVHGAMNDLVIEETNKLMGKDAIRERKGDVETRLVTETEMKQRNTEKARRYNPVRVSDLKEQLEWIINQEPNLERRELKRRVIEQRMLGRNDRETGEELGITADYANKLRGEVAKVWKRLEEK